MKKEVSSFVFDVTRNFTLLGGWRFYLSIYLVTFHFARIEPSNVLDFTHPFGGRGKNKRLFLCVDAQKVVKKIVSLPFIFPFSSNDLYL